MTIAKFVIGPLDTNCYLLIDDRTKKSILIDPSVFDTGVKKYIEDNGIDVIYTVNTHGHADHIMGDMDFGYPVILHSLAKPVITDPMKNMSFFITNKMPDIEVYRTLEDGDVIKAGKLEIKVIHTPGHTPGGISLKVEDCIFSGDTLFFEGIGRTDCPGGDYDTIIRSIKEKLFIYPDEVKVFPGHGPETTIGHEKQQGL